MSRFSLRLFGSLIAAAGVAACGPGHQPAYIGPSVELEYAFPKTSPDRVWSAVDVLMEREGWPVDSLSVADRKVVSGWMPAPEGFTDCGSYREVPGNVDPFENEEYRVRITVRPEAAGSRVRVWSDHRATGWYGEVIDDCVTTGRVQEDVRAGIVAAMRPGAREGA